MRSGTLKFNSLQLDAYGTPSLSIQRTKQPASTERPSFYETRYTVSVEIDSLAPSTSRAKIEAIKQGLDTTEGLLEFTDENGYGDTWLVRPVNDNIGEILKTGYGTMQIVFSGNEPVNQTNTSQEATFTPSNGGAVINIHRIESFREDVKTSRKDERVGTRSLTTSTVMLSGRTAWADLNLDYDSRMAWLDSERVRLKGMDTKQGTLVRGGFSETVQMENMSFKIGGNAEFLMIELQCRYSKLPGSNTAEAEFSVSDDTDWKSSKIIRRIQGTIEAPNETIAEAKFDALAIAYQTFGFRRRKQSLKKAFLDGADEALSTPELTKYDFSLEYDQIWYLTWKLDIDTEKTANGNRITYSGSVLSANYTLAINKAREIGNQLFSPHPVQVSSKETVTWHSDIISFGDGDTLNDPNLNIQEFIQVKFSYTYAVAATEIRASISQQISKPAFGDYVTSISGEITAATEAAAQTAARAYQPSGICLRENTETSSSIVEGTDTQWTKINFNYAWHVDHSDTTLKYSDSVATDHKSITAIRTISGTARAVDKATAEASIDALIGSPIPNNGKLLAKTVTEQKETCGLEPGGSFIQADFSITIEEDYTGVVGHDIIEASVQIDRTGQVQHDPIVPIPCGKPHKQTMAGSYTIGKLTVSGSCTALVEATAVNWGQAHRATVMTFGDALKRAERPPRETKKANYRSFEGTTPKSYTFNFSYSAEFADGLLGIWPGNELLLTPSS